MHCTDRVRRAVRPHIDALLHQSDYRRDGDAVILPTATLIVRVPRSDEPASKRDLEHYPQVELDLALESMVRDAIVANREALISRMRTLFGFARAGAKMRTIFDASIERLKQQSKLQEDAHGSLRIVE